MQVARDVVAALPVRRDANLRAAQALHLSAAGCLAAMFAGQLMFATYLLGFYGRTAAEGRPEAWNDVLAGGHVPGDTVGNLVLASHLAFGFAVTVGGVLQMLPWLRQRWPRFHRWNGRFFALSAIAASLGGLFLIWTRTAAGDLAQHLAISFNAVLILAFTALAWRNARARRFDMHRRWAMRLFLVVNGGWFFRIGLMLWIVLNQGPVGFDPKTFSGPFLTFLAFAQYLLPLVLLELYLRAHASGTARLRTIAAATLGAATLATLGGVAAASAILWLPRL
jgi:hypothetical protein